jgi:putative ABC transport system substrate-binding protein
MKRHRNIKTVLLLIGFIVANIHFAEAQQPKKVYRIGYLTNAFLSDSPRTEVFRQSLREFGYIEGKNIFIEWRSGEGNLDRRRPLAAELVRLKLDLIVAVGPGDARAAREATATIPIVMIQGGDPVGSGLVASLARPGGNITGLSALSLELSGKRLELLKEVIPKLSCVAFFGNSMASGNSQVLKETEGAAGALGLQIRYQEVQSANEIEPAFQATSKGCAQAVLVSRNLLTAFHHAWIAELAVKSRLPTMYANREFVEAGGLMSYGADDIFIYRRAATYVDRILKGAKPADLPVEQPTKFELVINLKTAKQIGVTIPPNVLARADRVIK